MRTTPHIGTRYAVRGTCKRSSAAYRVPSSAYPFFALIIVLSLNAQNADAPQPQARAAEQITVERILIDARVTDAGGDPILGLTPDDFEVRIDGVRAKVEAADWMAETDAARALADAFATQPATTGTTAEQAPAGRLFIYFFQTDFGRNNVRLAGQMSFTSYADEMIDDLEPEDRVCVFSFDSHLKFRSDFIADKRRLKELVRESVRIDQPAPPPVVANPSVGRKLDPEQMKKCTGPDEALILIANAVRAIPGPKSLILFGWGLGHLTAGQVVMDRKYPIARYALETSRVSVFALDFTQADWHSLEVGLGKAAADTGGFYAKTYQFPQIAVERLKKTLEGHYELEVRKPDIERKGTHTIEVQVKKKGALVLARSTYVDRE